MKEPCGLKILKAFFTLGYPFKLLENEIYDRTYISEVRTKHRLNSEPVTKILKNVRSSTGRFKRRASHAWCWEGRHNPQLNITSQNFTAFRRVWTTKNRIFKQYRKPVLRRLRLLSWTADNKSQTNMARFSASAQCVFCIFGDGLWLPTYVQHYKLPE